MDILAAVTHYADKWNLSDTQPLSETYTSHLYRAESEHGTVVLKLLTEVGLEDEKAAAQVLRWYAGQGAIRLWKHDEKALLLEYADGGDLVEFVRRGEDDEATGIIATVLNKLHFNTVSKPPEGITPLDRRFQALFNKADTETSTIYTRAAVVARRLLADNVPSHVLHGDIHHENIMHHSERGWLAIDPKGLFGDRTYDAANALCNPNSLPEVVQNQDRLTQQTKVISNALDLNPERLLYYVYAHSCLSACWSLEDDQDPSHALKMADLAERCLDERNLGMAKRPPALDK